MDRDVVCVCVCVSVCMNIYVMEYYSALKKNGIRPSAAK